MYYLQEYNSTDFKTGDVVVCRETDELISAGVLRSGGVKFDIPYKYVVGYGGSIGTTTLTKLQDRRFVVDDVSRQVSMGIVILRAADGMSMRPFYRSNCYINHFKIKVPAILLRRECEDIPFDSSEFLSMICGC